MWYNLFKENNLSFLRLLHDQNHCIYLLYLQDSVNIWLIFFPTNFIIQAYLNKYNTLLFTTYEYDAYAGPSYKIVYVYLLHGFI